MMPSWCQQVNWGNCGISWVNCATFCVKGDWKGQFRGLRCQNWAVYSVFPSGITSTVKLFRWTENVVGTLDGFFYRAMIFPSTKTTFLHMSLSLLSVSGRSHPVLLYLNTGFDTQNFAHPGCYSELSWLLVTDVSGKPLGPVLQGQGFSL
jgi:hypothetical protein